MTSRQGIILKIIILLIIISFGFLFIGFGLSTSSFPEKSTYFQKTLSGYIGKIAINMTPQKAFVVGNNITTWIGVNLSNNYVANHTLYIEMYFPDAVVQYSGGDEPFPIEMQDWSFRLNEKVPLQDSTMYYREVNLIYINDGTYGLNMTIYQFDTGVKTDAYFPIVVQINPLSYIDEKTRADSLYALNFELLGLSVITLAPIFILFANLVEKLVEKQHINSDKFVGDDI